jgi:REP element-mobilizing transposase RayT
LNGRQARAVASGFWRAAAEGDYAIHACAILPDHAHLVIGRHGRPLAQIVAHLKGRATQELSSEGIHPMARYGVEGAIPSPWARKYWKVFIDDDEWVRNAIGYVERNPEKEGKRAEHWNMVCRTSVDMTAAARPGMTGRAPRAERLCG